MSTSRLNFLLTHFLSSSHDLDLFHGLDFVLEQVSRDGGRILREAESAAVNRWNNKISALIAGTPICKTVGLTLAKASLLASPALWRSAASLGASASSNFSVAKTWFDLAYKTASVGDTV